MGSWKFFSADKKEELFCRRYTGGESAGTLAQEVDINVLTLDRYLRAWRTERAQLGYGEAVTPVATKVAVVEPVVSAEPAQVAVKTPNFEELFDKIKKAGTVSLDHLSKEYDRSKDTVIGWIDGMRTAGYVIDEEHGKVTFQNVTRPKSSYKPARTLADEMGQEVVFGVASDLHAGSNCSQPSAYNRFCEIAYNEYGVRHFFDPGDKTTGVGGYRGQEHDFIPALRGLPATAVTEAQIYLADIYTPKLPGATHYKLGGNHDYWHVVKNGIDAVARLCNQRDDMVYLGYDVADIPITDRVDARLFHPTGGIPYALSYRLQKSLEGMAFDELNNAVNAAENPKMRILLAGHLHVEVKFQRGPMVAAHVGCFEGQTNYLKRKGLYPTVGGCVFKVRLTDSGIIQRTEYTFIGFNEVVDDWKNFPLPPMVGGVHNPDELQTLFKVHSS